MMRLTRAGVAAALLVALPAPAQDADPAGAGALRIEAVQERARAARAALEADFHDRAAREALADLTIRVAAAIEAAEAAGDAARAARLATLIRRRLGDTLWRTGFRAGQGDPDAQAALGTLHRLGVLAERDPDKACELYARAAAAGHALAIRRARACADRGGEPPAVASDEARADGAQAVPAVAAAADDAAGAAPVVPAPAGPLQDAPLAGAAALVARLASGIEDAEALGRSEAAEALQGLIEARLGGAVWRVVQRADAGDADAQLALAVLRRRGIVVAPDQRRACALYAGAARSGAGAALFRQSRCVAGRDPAAAAALLRRAAGAGHPGAQEQLARECLQQRAPRDVACALEWLCRAAGRGRTSAQSLLAWMWASGEAGRRDPERAFFLYTLAARDGDLIAQNNLGEIHERGALGEPQPELAAVWYKRAARDGFAIAQINLARLYADGRGVPRDDAEAAHWLELAAAQGEPRASELLEWLRDEGRLR